MKLSFQLIAVVFLGTLGCRAQNTLDDRSTTAASPLSKIVDPSGRAADHQGEPWVEWAWYPGNRIDDDLSRPQKTVGVAKGILDLDEVRAKMVSRNLIDTEGYYGAGPKKDRQASHAWTGMDSGRICDLNGENCEDIVGCGPENMSNRRFRARTLNGTCNDFDNAMMGSFGTRMARNTPINAVNKALSDFNNGASKPDVVAVADEFLVRKSPEMHAPAPHFNLWAAAWIQFMTHDWFSHSKDGFNHSSKSYRMSSGPDIPATLDEQRSIGTKRLRCKLLEQQGKSCLTPQKSFHNHQTHWWDASQLYGFDKESHDRVRVKDASGLYTAKLKIENGLLPDILIAKYGNQKQEAAGFIDNWWVGLSLLHTMFTKNHNYLVDELRRSSPPPEGVAAWDEESLYDTARLINSALLAKIHTVEWTPQLLFNRLGQLVLQANWHGVANYSTRDIQDFRQSVKETGISQLLSGVIGKIQESRCLLTPSLLGSMSGISNLQRQEHFCSPFALPEEFTTVYRLHSMMPDYIDLFDAQGRLVSQERLNDLRLPHENGRIPTKEVLREKAKELLVPRKCASGSCSFGIEDWIMTFGKHPAGQLTAGNFPQFLANIKVPAMPGGSFNLAAVDMLRDRERGVPRFNDFRELIGLKRLKSVYDFIDTELEYEIREQKTRQFGGTPKPLSSDPARLQEMVATRVAVLESQKNAVEKIRSLYGRTPKCENIGDVDAREQCIVDQVDVQVGIQAEFVRPHGFVISETQFQIFVVNASRRIFSDRFFTKAAFNEKFYTKWGMDYLSRTFFMDVIKKHFDVPVQTSVSGKALNGFEIWDRKVDGYSLCVDGSEWFDKYPNVKKTYRDLFCLEKS